MAKKLILGDTSIEIATAESVQAAINAALPAWLNTVTGNANGVTEIKGSAGNGVIKFSTAGATIGGNSVSFMADSSTVTLSLADGVISANTDIVLPADTNLTELADILDETP